MDAVTQSPSSTAVVPPVDAQVQHLLDNIAEVADGDASLEEMQRVVDLCKVYHIAQPDLVRDHPRPLSRRLTGL